MSRSRDGKNITLLAKQVAVRRSFMPAGGAFPEPFDLSIGAAFAIDVLPAHGPAVPFGAPGADHRSIGADRKWPFKLVLHCRLSSSCTATRPARRASI